MEEYKNMNFGQALDLLISGKKLTRSNWNGKNMFVYYVLGSQFKANKEPLNTILGEGSNCVYRPHIDLKASDGTLGVWSASNSDILATDWEVID